jgi:biopolymer transport protein TolR
MAFGGGGAGRVKSDINVTPLVDVVLVMLIIFLVAMPVVMREITVDVPKKVENEEVQISTAQTTVEIAKGGLILLNGVAVDNRATLAEKLRAQLETKKEKVVFVDFDKTIRYGDVVSTMDLIKGSGATTVALKTKDENAPGPAPAGAPASPAPAAPASPAPNQ